ncbi:hypothetical protein ACIQH5_16745 [Paenarthrobacter sp. NPDC091711]|uniref:hypothetical protein n=1 Tax=Paenarthrobacter sp. NPDC091711 TaxID=3364385 RepID=UPI0038213F20
MKPTPRTLRSLTFFLAGFVPFAIFWPMYGAVAGFGIGLLVAAIVIAVDAALISRRKTRREVQVHPALSDHDSA